MGAIVSWLIRGRGYKHWLKVLMEMLIPRVLPDDLVSVLVSVEAVHEDQGHVGRVLLVEELYLLHRQVQEGQI